MVLYKIFINCKTEEKCEQEWLLIYISTCIPSFKTCVGHWWYTGEQTRSSSRVHGTYWPGNNNFKVHIPIYSMTNSYKRKLYSTIYSSIHWLTQQNHFKEQLGVKPRRYKYWSRYIRSLNNFEWKNQVLMSTTESIEVIWSTFFKYLEEIKFVLVF